MIGVAYAKEFGAWIARSFYSPEKFDQSVSMLCWKQASKTHLILGPSLRHCGCRVLVLFPGLYIERSASYLSCFDLGCATFMAAGVRQCLERTNEQLCNGHWVFRWVHGSGKVFPLDGWFTNQSILYCCDGCICGDVGYNVCRCQGEAIRRYWRPGQFVSK